MKFLFNDFWNLFEFRIRDVIIEVWRRPGDGYWGYGSTYYDGIYHWFGFGRLLTISWGPR